jgi:uncharacterized protein
MHKRLAYQKLIRWKESSYRKPLIIRGARQVGKTTLIHQFAQEFEQYLYFNLEKKEDREVFLNRDSIKQVVDSMFFFRDKAQNNSKTLLFIDEIQALPQAVSLLRYFYEDYPHLYVIAAGSLLEAILNTTAAFPVGRVEYMSLHPFCFEEFLLATSSPLVLEMFNTIPLPEFAHTRLLKLFHQYTLTGGMPEAVLRYSEKLDIVALKPVFESLLVGYMDDIEKYAKNYNQTNILRHAIPACLKEAGSRIRFHGFGNSTYGSREMGEALRTIEKTRLVTLVYPTTQVGPPYSSDYKKSPRLQVVDTGLVIYFAGIQKDVFQAQDLNAIFQGRIVEHIVGQEFTAISESELHKLLFWVRDKTGTTSELDFVFLHEGLGIPVEVKSGQTGSLRSLHQYIDMSKRDIAIRLYSGPFRIDEIQTLQNVPYRLLNIPYYHAAKLSDYLNLFL